LLSEILKQTDAKIVLSTSWRLFGYMLQFLLEKLRNVAIDHEDIIGRTISLAHPKQRVDEIREWLEGCPCTVLAWVALDDEDLWSEDPELMKGHFVKTSSDVGLRSNHVEDAIFILNRHSEVDIERDKGVHNGNAVASTMV